MSKKDSNGGRYNHEMESLRQLNEKLEMTIAELREKDKTLKESEEKYRSLVESTDDSIYLIDKNYRYLFMNKKHSARMGFTGNEYVGKEYSELHSMDEIKPFVKNVDRVLETGNPVQHEHRSHRDGGYFLQTFSPVKNPDGDIAAISVVSKNITKIHQLIADLKDALAEIKTLKGLIPLCSRCGKARDDRGFWKGLDAYVKEHSVADFSRDVCPECLLSDKTQEVEPRVTNEVFLFRDRRTGSGRRLLNDQDYSGDERRSGQDRRSGRDRRQSSPVEPCSL